MLGTLVGPFATAGKNLVPPAQGRLPAEVPTPQGGAKEAQTHKPPDLVEVKEAVADIQRNLRMIHGVDLQFSVHEASGEIMVTVLEESTGEVIREIPPSEVLDLAARLGGMVGLLFDQTG